MRADRLLSVLLFLQSRGRVTVRDVAEELEVSERTARRDLDALAMAGVPIYSRQGRNGGWELVGGARTDLTGLTATEARAFFLAAGPAAAASPTVKAAVRKLVQAMPEPLRIQAESASTAVVVEAEGWRGNRRPSTSVRPEFLDRIERAVVEAEQLELGYADRTGKMSTRTVHPLGLASKQNVWYLVADTDTGMRTFRVSRVRSADGTGRTVVRPPDFDLANAWHELKTAFADSMPLVWASGRAVPDALPRLRNTFGERLRLGPQGPPGFQLIEIAGPSFSMLANELAPHCSSVIIETPVEVINALVAIGQALLRTYQTQP